jgi:methylmalonyl-CoA mutase N-terminal domain/subunit
LKSQRNAVKVQDSLSAIENAARSNDNLMPHIIEAVEVYATLGEIADSLRTVFGEYR